jgi:hypothetical protein
MQRRVLGDSTTLEVGHQARLIFSRYAGPFGLGEVSAGAILLRHSGT